MQPPEDPGRSPRIAVAIPCYNEAAAVGRVVDDFRAHLPGAEIVVFDNASDDATAAIAADRGARVVPVPDRGKGFAVRAAFATLKDYDVVVMVDGDGTYPAEAAPRLVEPVLGGRAEMTVGARRPVPGAQAMAPIRALGNVLIRSTFRILIGPGTGDLLSGYRAFSRRFVEAVDLRSEGFEIETELAVAATARGFPTIEIDVPYHPRIAGTESKLRAFRDGRRILATIARESLRLRPWRAATLATAVAVGAAALLYLAIR
ncbi:glycosyltransferase [Paludisphaera mucosa]|uniref:Glycosyltransferase n=1 Tax=Paludisphaera mucosa TaxID=3030827 RepID=A0ABT6FH78_9BACT|nr:glycosyltransferase [Paludisphaera mucosa]